MIVETYYGLLVHVQSVMNISVQLYATFDCLRIHICAYLLENVCMYLCVCGVHMHAYICVMCQHFLVAFFFACVQVHVDCRKQYHDFCSLGDLHSAILPPSVLQKSDSIRKGMWEVCTMQCVVYLHQQQYVLCFNCVVVACWI